MFFCILDNLLYNKTKDIKINIMKKYVNLFLLILFWISNICLLILILGGLVYIYYIDNPNLKSSIIDIFKVFIDTNVGLIFLILSIISIFVFFIRIIKVRKTKNI